MDKGEAISLLKARGFLKVKQIAGPKWVSALVCATVTQEDDYRSCWISHGMNLDDEAVLTLDGELTADELIALGTFLKEFPDNAEEEELQTSA